MQSLGEFEEAVFCAASHFVLSRRVGIGQYERIEVRTSPEARALLAAAPQPDRVFVYAVTAEGRSTLLNGARMRSGRWDQLWRPPSYAVLADVAGPFPPEGGSPKRRGGASG
jgi:hypothetical protein